MDRALWQPLLQGVLLVSRRMRRVDGYFYLPPQTSDGYFWLAFVFIHFGYGLAYCIRIALLRGRSRIFEKKITTYSRENGNAFILFSSSVANRSQFERFILPGNKQI